MTGPTQIVVFANRLPIARTLGGWRPASGGLVTALRPVLEASRGAWVGWSGSKEEPPAHVSGLSLDLRAVPLSPRLVAAYYHGFSNQTLWPLFHDLVHQPIIDRSWWEAYRGANELFAGTAGAFERPRGQPPVLWVHDYHLMLLPRLLRQAGSRSRILYFLHTPFPAPELFARLPWRAELLQGVRGADVVGFHTDMYRENSWGTETHAATSYSWMSPTRRSRLWTAVVFGSLFGQVRGASTRLDQLNCQRGIKIGASGTASSISRSCLVPTEQRQIAATHRGGPRAGGTSARVGRGRSERRLNPPSSPRPASWQAPGAPSQAQLDASAGWLDQ